MNTSLRLQHEEQIRAGPEEKQGNRLGDCSQWYSGVMWQVAVGWWQWREVERLNRENSELEVLRLDLGGGNGTPLQYSCLENPMDGEAW